MAEKVVLLNESTAVHIAIVRLEARVKLTGVQLELQQTLFYISRLFQVKGVLMILRLLFKSTVEAEEGRSCCR